jgi:CspA family cold shock protein
MAAGGCNGAVIGLFVWPFEISPDLATSPLGLSKITLNSDIRQHDGRAAEKTPMCVIGATLMAVGTVKFFNSQKGFGFIQPTDGGPDVFVHVSAVERAGMRGLVEGQKISYDVVSERGKTAASNLQNA